MQYSIYIITLLLLLYTTKYVQIIIHKKVDFKYH